MHGCLVAMLEQETTLIDGARTMPEATAIFDLPGQFGANSSHEGMIRQIWRPHALCPALLAAMRTDGAT